MDHEGCTKERRQHSRITTEPRSVTGGGIVTGYGNRDEEHCYLDFLKNRGLLGNEPKSSYRYETGYRLRNLYFSFNPSGKTLSEIMAHSPGSQFVTDENVDSPQAEDIYHDIMSAMESSHVRILRYICFETMTPVKGDAKFHRLIVRALDDLKNIFDMMNEK